MRYVFRVFHFVRAESRKGFPRFVDAHGDHLQLHVCALPLICEHLPQIIDADVPLSAFVRDRSVFVCRKQSRIHVTAAQGEELFPAFFPFLRVECCKGSDQAKNLFRRNLCDSGLEVFQRRLHVVNPVGGNVTLIDGVRAAALLHPVLTLRSFEIKCLSIKQANQLDHRFEIVNLVPGIVQRLFPETVAAWSVAAGILVVQHPAESVRYAGFPASVHAEDVRLRVCKINRQAADAFEVRDVDLFQ